MAYAPSDRSYYDADSHIMELPDFLQRYADPELRHDIPAVSYSASLVTDEEVAEIMARGGHHTDEHVQNLLSLGDRLIEQSKEIQALGAFDGRERSRALDLLGFKKQLVFATHSVALPFSASSKLSSRVRYGAARAHNRHMLEFCSHDQRLMGVAIVPLDDPACAGEELDFALKSGLRAAWIPHRPCGDKSPGHVALDPFWARLEETGTPFLLHVGGSPLQLEKVWTNNGRAPVKDWMGGGENLRTKDAAVMHQPPETFISMMVIDGVFERYPRLRGAAVELGAGWVPTLLERLDWVVRQWSRTDPVLAKFTRKPSEQLTQQMAFTPFVFEDVGSLIDRSNPDLYMFSTDYPHTEGGRDPLARFERSLARRSTEIRDRFYAQNFLRIFPDARAS
ncbi:MAG TPA: amidohydrolase family protein [Candidatus Binataceae bacterium]|nr:amidohydrolase family protein [Candidatus Binataceae bacterium]